ncbi:hypothetical protein AAIB46_10855 [Streptomyces sp. 35M1]
MAPITDAGSSRSASVAWRPGSVTAALSMPPPPVMASAQADSR